METAQAQQRTHEDDILKLEERVGHLTQAVADLERQQEDCKNELSPSWRWNRLS